VTALNKEQYMEFSKRIASKYQEKRHLEDFAQEIIYIPGIELIWLENKEGILLYFFCKTQAALTAFRDVINSQQLPSLSMKLNTLSDDIQSPSGRGKQISYSMLDYDELTEYFHKGKM